MRPAASVAAGGRLLLSAWVLAWGGLGQAGAADTALTFTTLAGSSGTVVNNIDGTGSAAQFYAPRGVAVDSTGTVYLADSSNHTIRKVIAVRLTEPRLPAVAATD